MKGVRYRDKILVVGDVHEGWTLTNIELIEPGASFGQYRFIFTRGKEVRTLRNNFRSGENVFCSVGFGWPTPAPPELAGFGSRNIQVVDIDCDRQATRTED